MDINQLMQIIGESGGSPSQNPVPKKSGLQFYTGGNEKTPTGKTGAFNEDYNVTPEFLTNWIKEHNFTDKSNIEFQKELLSRLKSHPEYKNVIGKVEDTYGPTKAGVYDDGLFGSRTVALMSAYDEADKMANARKEFFGNKNYYYTNPQGQVYDFGKNEKAFKSLDTNQATEITGAKLDMFNKLRQLKENSKKKTDGEGN